MSGPTNRREFLRNAGVAGLGFAILGAEQIEQATRPGATRPAKVERPVVIGVIGTGNRGMDHAAGFAALPGSFVKYVCDVDSGHVRAAAAVVARRQDLVPTAVEDLRRVLDDKSVDAVTIATPDHWHAAAAILACSAGKHVYLEKPCCHNALEGERLVEAVRKHNVIIQHGTQRRSWPKVIEAIGRVRAGDIGRVLVSRGWYTNHRPQTGRRTPANVPPGLNWELWQGPAPRRPFTNNVVPYKWHWYWNWGTGELGNNGVHALDLCRWGLGVDYPRRVTAGGGRYYFDDDQETPDTLSVAYDFGDRAILWEGRSCQPRGFEGSDFGVAFYGDNASLISDGTGYRIFDSKGKSIEHQTGPAGDAGHFQNFLDCVRSGKNPAADVNEAYKSTLLCHLGNIAFRVGGVVNCDPQTGRILATPAAQKLWSRDYETGWEPRV